MSLKIINTKFSKDAYEFGVDKEMELEFVLESKDKEYNLNSIYVEYGIKTKVKSNDFGIKIIEKIIISEAIQITKKDSKKFNVKIPIKYPNFKSGKYKIENYIKITADINFNVFNSTFELFPIVKLNNKKWKNILLSSEDYKGEMSLKEELDSMIEYLNKDEYDKIDEKIDELNSQLEEPEIDFDKFEIELQKLVSERDKYVKYKNKKRAEEIKNELNKITKEYNVSNSNYVYLSDNDDYVNKDVYDYLLKKSIIFRFKNNRFFEKIAYISGFVASLGFAFLIFISPFFPSSAIPVFFLILLGVLFLAIYLFLGEVYNLNLGNIIFLINIGNNKIIKTKFNDNSLSFSDIIKDIKINYNGKYKCDFDLTLDCILLLGIQEGSGKNSHVNVYSEIIYSIFLGKYSGNNLDYNSINKFTNLNKIIDIKIPTDYIYGNGFVGEYGRIIYNISYNFISQDLPDKFGTITIS